MSCRLGRRLLLLLHQPRGSGCLVRHITSSNDPRDFQPRKALVLCKVTRYEFERRRFKDAAVAVGGGSEKEEEEEEGDFAAALARRGTDHSLLKLYHDIHEDSKGRLVRSLQNRGLETRVIQRFDYTEENVKWADVIFTAGGDGTFLLGASRLPNNVKPIIGINTDPTRSSGHLCLPAHLNEADYISVTVDKILRGDFSWLMRKRLHVTLIGDEDKIREPPLELYNQKLNYPEYRYVEMMNERHTASDHPLRELEEEDRSEEEENKPKKSIGQHVLPVLALNEVFVGESLSSRVSYLEVKLDDDQGDFVKTRNSGLCISTGTGSTSWTFNINKLTKQSVRSILRILEMEESDRKLVEAVTKRFNEDIVFSPEVKSLAYTLRDPVQLDSLSPRGLAKDRIEVKSRCFDACLVIDGSLSFRFNDGTRAIIQMRKDGDELRTVNIHE